MGIWLADEGLRASDHQWWTKGFDGFLGYGSDSTGNCCEDCICADQCSQFVQIWIQYHWQNPCVDLDTSTKVYPPNAETKEENLFANYGYACDHPDLPIDPDITIDNNLGGAIQNERLGNVHFLEYIDKEGEQKKVGGIRSFTGDNTGVGGFEKIGILLSLDYQDNFTQDHFWRVELHAHWFPEFNLDRNVEKYGTCPGDFVLYITDTHHDPNEDNTLETMELNTKEGFDDCSVNRVATLIFNSNEYKLTKLT
jgi:hypothetical protein